MRVRPVLCPTRDPQLKVQTNTVNTWISSMLIILGMITTDYPISSQCFISIPHENLRKEGFFDVFRRYRNGTLA